MCQHESSVYCWAMHFASCLFAVTDEGENKSEDMIFIKKLTIQNYKCFENEPIDFNSPDGKNEGSGLNILIGENGNGKTAILESINYLTLSSFSTENRLSINDFYDYQKEIAIRAETNIFDCKSTIDFYKDWTFQSNGLEFSAKSRNSKARGKTPFITIRSS